jgi:hypothetical protein
VGDIDHERHDWRFVSERIGRGAAVAAPQIEDLMATFKVGDRVRCVSVDPYPYPYLVGLCGVIVHVYDKNGSIYYATDFSGHKSKYDDGFCRMQGYMLAPLTDPKADAWAADAVRKVTKPQHVEPVAPVEFGVPVVPLAMVEWRGDGPDGGWWVRD